MTFSDGGGASVRKISRTKVSTSGVRRDVAMFSKALREPNSFLHVNLSWPLGHHDLIRVHPAELSLGDPERSSLGQLDNHPTGVNELMTRTSLTASQVLATLSVLELKRLVRRLPGHQFVRA